MKASKLWVIFSPLTFLFFFGGCAKVYIQLPDDVYDKPSGKEIIAESPPEKYSGRSQDRQEYEKRDENYRSYRQPLPIRQGLERMAQAYNMNPEEFSRAYEEAISLSRNKNHEVWKNLRLRNLQNDGSINRISQGYTRISGWLHETRVGGQIIAIFIPASRNFVVGIAEEQLVSKKREEPPTSNYRKPDITRKIPTESANQEEDIIEEVAPVSDEEAEEYYHNQQRGEQQ